MSNEYHSPVLVDEVLRFLQPSEGGVYVDGTLGGGGHAEAILMNSPAHTSVIGFDMDAEAIAFAQERLRHFSERFRSIHDNVANMRARLLEVGVRHIRGMLLDLGISSHQIDVDERGFSFQKNGRIDMRMNRRQSLDGWTVVNRYEEKRLADILWRYGEERNSRAVARRIIDARKKGPVETTKQLSEIVESVAGKRFLQKSLARVFQAIRIEVNGELDSLNRVLLDTVGLLEKGGRIVVISYHSLEDRMVKQFFKNESSTITPSATKLLPGEKKQAGINVLTRKPVTASQAEVAGNPRSASAKLRAAERI